MLDLDGAVNGPPALNGAKVGQQGPHDMRRHGQNNTRGHFRHAVSSIVRPGLPSPAEQCQYTILPTEVPPQTNRVCPVTNPASGAMKNLTARATSSGLPR